MFFFLLETTSKPRSNINILDKERSIQNFKLSKT